MEEQDIYQGLSKTQITKFKKEESACNTHWDFLSFSEKLFEAGANIWLKKICLEQFKKEDYGTDIRWHDNQECPSRVSNAIDNTTKNFTGLITIKCSDNFENFIKNDVDYHDEEYKKIYGGSEDFTPRYPNSKFIWEVNCKNGKIKNPSASFSDYCKEEEILNTLGNGKNIFKLNQLIWENRLKNN